MLFTYSCNKGSTEDSPINDNDSLRINQDTTIHPFLYKNKIWSIGSLGDSYLGLPFYPIESHYIKIGKDTLFDSQIWYKVIRSDDKDHQIWDTIRYGYVREKDNRIYYKSNLNDSERLFYDFNLHAGDTFFLTPAWFYQGYTFQVDSIKLIPLLDKIKRKHFYIHQINRKYNKAVLIEGIGSVNGFFNNAGMLGAVGGLERLICVEEDGYTIYKDLPIYGFNKCFFEKIW